MSAIDLNDYVAGGYFVTKYGDRDRYGTPRSPDLLPTQLVSLSDCVQEKLQPNWGWDSTMHLWASRSYGIPQDKLQAFHDWRLNVEAGVDNIYSLNAAREFISDFLPSQDNLLLLGAGLHRELVNSFLTPKLFPWLEPNNKTLQLANEQLKDHLISERLPLEEKGNILGFEVVSFHFNLMHSWLCSNLERDMYELFNIRPNAHGLIDTYEDAKRVYEWIAEDNLRGSRAEPEPYYPWLIVQYPLVENSL